MLIGLLILFSSRVHAQEEDPPDSSFIEAAPSDEGVVDEGYKDTPVATKSVYFTDKKLQQGNGVPQLQSRMLPDSVEKKIKADGDFWYVNYQFEKEELKKEEEPDTPFTEEPLFQTLLWLVIIGGFAAVVIMYLSNSNIGLFRKNTKPVTGEGEEYIETDNIFEINYTREIDRAISNGNYRLAVRLLFLKALKNLSDKKVIQYKQDRTNFDYLMQLHSTKYYNDFFRITRDYEYCWYGQFDIEPGKFSLIKSDFENFDRNLK